ncbi:MAG: aminopeptidase P family protein [Rhodobacteraceae bacterium]|nr:aminopeptidase P family protein [Paracoccaceae bacterium]
MTLQSLRQELAQRGLDGFLVPRTDMYQGEYVAACDERLAWISGFTGSAGLLAVLSDRAALFVDGRYELQAANQVDTSQIEVVAIRETKPSDWLEKALSEINGDGAVLGVDPWLHATAELARYGGALEKGGARIERLESNPLDAVWADRPAPPDGLAWVHPLIYSGACAAEKRAQLAESLRKDGLDAAFLHAPESACWLLNLRGSDVPRTPILRAQALIHADAKVTLFANPAQLDESARRHLGDAVTIIMPTDAVATLAALNGAKVAVDKNAAPAAVGAALEAAVATIEWRQEIAQGPKARKNTVEVQGARTAQLRDGAALSTALAWIDREAATGRLDELTVSAKLTEIRTETAKRLGSELRDLSFDAIVGFGPNGAIVHYRVDTGSNRPIQGDGLLLIDSGGQYPDGTTDVTRTVAVGAPLPEAVGPYTRVLKGMIAISELRFPPKTTGRDIEAFARAALWQAGLDFDHGVGHGVGSYLSVHEGPASISRRNTVALEAGMILSNEPGYYRVGAFGIRIENLVIVQEADKPEGGDRKMHGFETLTLIPIDRRLIDVAMLTTDEQAWLDAYHARVLREVGPLVDEATRIWLQSACAPLSSIG